VGRRDACLSGVNDARRYPARYRDRDLSLRAGGRRRRRRRRRGRKERVEFMFPGTRARVLLSLSARNCGEGAR
jgi:hypothetical protein